MNINSLSACFYLAFTYENIVKWEPSVFVRWHLTLQTLKLNILHAVVFIQICLSDLFSVNLYNSHSLIKPKNNINIKVHIISKFQILKMYLKMINPKKGKQKTPDQSSFKKWN